MPKIIQNAGTGVVEITSGVTVPTQTVVSRSGIH